MCKVGCTCLVLALCSAFVFLLKCEQSVLFQKYIALTGNLLLFTLFLQCLPFERHIMTCDISKHRAHFLKYETNHFEWSVSQKKICIYHIFYNLPRG